MLLHVNAVSNVSIFLRATAYYMLYRVYAIAVPSVCLSVRLSVSRTGGSYKNGWS